MTNWRFGEAESDGDVWLQRAGSVPVYVEFEKTRSDGGLEWRRVLVATKSWLAHQLAGVTFDGTRPRWAALPLMLVVPDASPAELRRVVDLVVQDGGFDEYSSLVE